MDLYDVFPVLRRGYWYGNYDEQKYKEYQFWHDGIGNVLSLGLTGAHIDYSISQGKSDAYMERYGIDYSDIVDPSKLYSNGSVYSRGYNFVSSNISRLYR